MGFVWDMDLYTRRHTQRHTHMRTHTNAFLAFGDRRFTSFVDLHNANELIRTPS